MIKLCEHVIHSHIHTRGSYVLTVVGGYIHVYSCLPSGIQSPSVDLCPCGVYSSVC